MKRLIFFESLMFLGKKQKRIFHELRELLKDFWNHFGKKKFIWKILTISSYFGSNQLSNIWGFKELT